MVESVELILAKSLNWLDNEDLLIIHSKQNLKYVDVMSHHQ